MKPFITIFTPTYNRAHLLDRLYASLEEQSDQDFEWLIVDDGSTDNTEQLIKDYLVTNNITIRYYKQNNGGKHKAINKGIQLASGELFFIVDSDDFLPENSLQRIKYYYEKIENDESIAGIVGKRLIINNNIKNIQFHQSEFMSNFFDIRYKENYNGDMAEIIRTSVIKQFYFPLFKNEKFCTEAVIWNRISQNYSCLFFDEFIYCCEYQDGGLTSNYWNLLLNNPNGSLLYFKELLQFPLKKGQKKDALKAYNNIAKVNGYSKFRILNEIGFRNFIKIYFS